MSIFLTNEAKVGGSSWCWGSARPRQLPCPHSRVSTLPFCREQIVALRSSRRTETEAAPSPATIITRLAVAHRCVAPKTTGIKVDVAAAELVYPASSGLGQCEERVQARNDCELRESCRAHEGCRSPLISMMSTGAILSFACAGTWVCKGLTGSAQKTAQHARCAGPPAWTRLSPCRTLPYS